MRTLRHAVCLLVVATPTISALQVASYDNETSYVSLEQNLLSFDAERPKDCPPCFNCQLPDFKCQQYAPCQKSNGKCACPAGFGAEDCSEPLCGSLAHGRERAPRGSETSCECEEGWSGINCNVCQTDMACNALMPTGDGGVCYKGGIAVKQNFQMCDVTNRKIRDQLKEQKPQVTFSCQNQTQECSFQFWVDQKESFYCALDSCQTGATFTSERNITTYDCEHIKCSCIPGRMLCGQDGSIDIGDFLDQEIKGPASFRTITTEGGSPEDGSKFEEPAMNDLIKSVFGDESITLDCAFGECLYRTDVPGYVRPIKRINTPLIAGLIAGASLSFVLVVILVWLFSRRTRLLAYGSIQLPTDEDDDDKFTNARKAATLYYDDVGYVLDGITILSGIQGVAQSGQVTAIMGASGAGKSTFLDILARKSKRGTIGGSFSVNGEKVLDIEYRNVIGFVDQEDTMLPTLTVHETIMNSALLRLPRELSFHAKEQRVYEVERQLGISYIKDQMIGSEEGVGRGISGGEKRRVGIACELVTSPSILLLDEPTSGLDAYNAYNVIECLVTLAKHYNRTVIFTIHQPRSNIVALFDSLVLLAKGRMVYSGAASKCQAYFDSLGYQCPPGFNIADYVVDLTMHAGAASLSEDEDRDLLSAERDASHSTGPSSTRAIKSIPSRSLRSNPESIAGSPATSSFPRPSNLRRESIRQQQERQLYSQRRASLGTETPQSDEEVGQGLLNPRDWLKMNHQRQGNRSALQELNGILPDAVATGTELDVLINAFARSDENAFLSASIKDAVKQASQANGTNDSNGTSESMPSASSGKLKGVNRISAYRQFLILSSRTWKNLLRNPMLLLTHYAIAILLAVLSGILFYGLTDDISGFQNRLGLFFFILALFGFSTLTSLAVFSQERLLFMRERANGYYAPYTYFLAKVTFDIIPLRLIPPLIMGIIVYPMTGLVPSSVEFFKFLLILVLFNFSASSLCLFVGIVFRDAGVANLIGSLVMLFSLLFAGLLLNHNAIPHSMRWLQSLSIFHYGFEALIVNEVRYLTLIDHKYGLDIEVPGATILSTFGFDAFAYFSDAWGLVAFTGVFLLLSYVAMHVLLVERR